MSTLDTSCKFAAKQASALAEVAYLTLSKEEFEYFRYRGGTAEKEFYKFFLWYLIERLDMSVADLE